MMKKAAGVVLGLPESSTYPREYACGSGFACGLANRPF